MLEFARSKSDSTYLCSSGHNSCYAEKVLLTEVSTSTAVAFKLVLVARYFSMFKKKKQKQKAEPEVVAPTPVKLVPYACKTLDTCCLHADRNFHPHEHDVAPPLHVSSTFEAVPPPYGLSEDKEYVYSRDNQPTSVLTS